MKNSDTESNILVPAPLESASISLRYDQTSYITRYHAESRTKKTEVDVGNKPSPYTDLVHSQKINGLFNVSKGNKRKAIVLRVLKFLLSIRHNRYRRDTRDLLRVRGRRQCDAGCSCVLGTCRCDRNSWSTRRTSWWPDPRTAACAWRGQRSESILCRSEDKRTSGPQRKWSRCSGSRPLPHRLEPGEKTLSSFLKYNNKKQKMVMTWSLFSSSSV